MGNDTGSRGAAAALFLGATVYVVLMAILYLMAVLS